MRVPLQGPAEALQLFGPQDSFLRALQAETDVTIVSRGGELLLRGETEEVQRVAKLFQILLEWVQQGIELQVHDAIYALQLVKENREKELFSLLEEVLDVSVKDKPVRARTLGQLRYVRAVRAHEITFGIGPAGTGKTFLAVSLAVSAYRARYIRRIVLTRPAVEAGERLGFLPGALQEKVDPYLRPLYDVLNALLGADTVPRMMDRGTIEIAPLAYMRGRTLEEAFVILDEAQNTTPEQMKMFLTRLGSGSKMVITGDITQVDLPRGQKSGLIEAQEILAAVEGIEFVILGTMDVVRHRLVRRIADAYAAAAQRLDPSDRRAGKGL